jgi:tetratricopeptide (TPR) repeat protein
MNNRFLLVSLSAALSLTSLPAHAQRRSARNVPSFGNSSPLNSATIRGVVRSAEQNAVLAMVRVELRTFGGEPVGVTFTNEDGAFTFFNVQPSNYQIVINQDGYEPVQESLDLSSEMGVANQMIFLKALPGHSPGAAGGLVSARELALPPKVKKDYNQGMSALYEKHKPEASLPLFARVIAQAPDFYRAYHHSGVAYERLGRNQEAEASLRKALELSQGRDAETQTALASVLVNLNRCSEAETFARQGLAASPGSWFAHYELARALIGLRRPDEAEKSIQETLGLNPNLPQAYLLLASVHMSRNDGLSLLKDLDNYLRLDTKGPQSDWARKTREQVQKGMAEAKAAGTPVAPHP